MDITHLLVKTAASPRPGNDIPQGHPCLLKLFQAIRIQPISERSSDHGPHEPPELVLGVCIRFLPRQRHLARQAAENKDGCVARKDGRETIFIFVIHTDSLA